MSAIEGGDAGDSPRVPAPERESVGDISNVRQRALGIPPEAIIQRIWQAQRIRRLGLRCCEGRPIQILHPGFLNREAGPDFLNAVVQVGAAAPRVGSVEIDGVAASWLSHGHDRNPRFRDVVLHVVWEPPERPVCPAPTLVLKDCLDAPLSDLEHLLEGPEGLVDLDRLSGRCRAVMERLTDADRCEALREAALRRLRVKAARSRGIAREFGWRGSLVIGVFDALGYKNNSWPMRRLGELAIEIPEGWTAENYQALLFGLSGLLAGETPGDPSATQEEDNPVRRVWERWWRLRSEWSDRALPRDIWRFDGTRPLNHPHRRIALGGRLLAVSGEWKRMESWIGRPANRSQYVRSMYDILDPGEDAEWDDRVTLGGIRLGRPARLLGMARASELVVNVVLPWLHARSVAGENDSLRQEVENRYLAWPRGRGNARSRHAQTRFFGSESFNPLPGEAGIQAALQIESDYCQQSNSLCEGCVFPDVLSK